MRPMLGRNGKYYYSASIDSYRSDAKAVQKVDDVFCGDVTAGTGCIRTATKSSNTAVDHTHPHLSHITLHHAQQAFTCQKLP